MTGIEDGETVLHCLLAQDREFIITVATSLDLGAAERLSRADLLELAGGSAAFLAAHGLKHGDRVVFFLDTSFALFAGVLAAWALGAITTIQPVHWPKAHQSIFTRRQRSIIEQTDPAIIIVSDELLPAVQALLPDAPSRGWKILPGSALETACRQNRRALPPIAAVGTDTAHLQFTSGSTGEPKGVPVRHRQALLHGQRCGERSNFSNASTMVNWLPMHHDFGFFIGLLMPLCTGGASIHIAPRLFIKSPSVWLQAISLFRATNTASPPSAIDVVCRVVNQDLVNTLDLSSLAVLTVAAEPLFHERLKTFERRFSESGLRQGVVSPAYGLAESIAAVTAHPVPSALTSQGHLDAAIVDCGVLLPGVELNVVGDDDLPLPDGHVGEITIRGDTVISRYWKDSAPARSWLPTGDLGFIRDGHLYVTGRKKDLIIRAGANLHPHWIENAVEAIPETTFGCSVLRACAFSVRDEAIGRERVVVAVETRRGANASADGAIRRAILDTVGIAIDDILFVSPGTIPRTTSGKLQRSLCRELLANSRVTA